MRRQTVLDTIALRPAIGRRGIARDIVTPRHGTAPSAALVRRGEPPDPVLLSGHSAATSDTHGIHQGRASATGAGGYPGVAVPGSLQANLLLDLRTEMTARAPW